MPSGRGAASAGDAALLICRAACLHVTLFDVPEHLGWRSDLRLPDSTSRDQAVRGMGEATMRLIVCMRRGVLPSIVHVIL